MPSRDLCHVSFLLHFQLVEDAVPPTVEVEDRHVEDKHRIVYPPAAPKHLAPFVAEILSWTLGVSSAKSPLTAYLIVHSVCFFLV
jgi:hypothetical protein